MWVVLPCTQMTHWMHRQDQQRLPLLSSIRPFDSHGRTDTVAECEIADSCGVAGKFHHHPLYIVSSSHDSLVRISAVCFILVNLCPAILKYELDVVSKSILFFVNVHNSDIFKANRIGKLKIEVATCRGIVPPSTMVIGCASVNDFKFLNDQNIAKFSTVFTYSTRSSRRVSFAVISSTGYLMICDPRTMLIGRSQIWITTSVRVVPVIYWICSVKETT
mmetsp:Transcript_655/g.1095  ORF Transcript_655/g.1095 Transcript_655/m.1095 type:complete len:219 (+) Transcript_655:670-1326(+)